jgi:hypothetical protein
MCAGQVSHLLVAAGYLRDAERQSGGGMAGEGGIGP